MAPATRTRQPRRVGLIVLTLITVVTTSLCAACDWTHMATFGAGYALGRWEGTRVEIVVTERMCYVNGERVPCPEE